VRIQEIPPTFDVLKDMYEEVQQVLEGLSESAIFCTSGQHTVVLPGMIVEGVGELSFPIKPDDAQKLIAIAEPAPYGRGEETILDTNVRRVWQLDPALISIENPVWFELVDTLVSRCVSAFEVEHSVEYDAYKMLIYEEGCFFVPHRDSEKEDGMFATFVLSLPSAHEGGQLHIHHDGQTKVIDFGGFDSKFQLQYGAFYTDCQHEVKPVTEGYRICIVYNLFITETNVDVHAPEYDESIAMLAPLLENIFKGEDSPDKLAIPLVHQYSEAGLDVHALKGEDKTRLEVLSRLADKLDMDVHLALMECWQSGTPDEDTLQDHYRYRYGRRRWDDYDEDDILDDESVEMDEVYDETLELSHWFDLSGREVPFGTLCLYEWEILTGRDFDGFDSRQEVEEASGNAGVSMERWYRHGMIVLWPKERRFFVLLTEGMKSAVPAFLDMCIQANSATERAELRELALELFKRWSIPKGFDLWMRGEEYLHTKMVLQGLYAIGAYDLCLRCIRDILPFHHHGSEAELLLQIFDEVGWYKAAKEIQTLFSVPSRARVSYTLRHLARLFADICLLPEEWGDGQFEVCWNISFDFVEGIKRFDVERKGKDVRESEGLLARIDSCRNVLRALCVLEHTELLESYTEYITEEPGNYPVLDVLVPLVKQCFADEHVRGVGDEALRFLMGHCVEQLKRLTAKPVPVPKDWKINKKLNCSCINCKALQDFLLDPASKTCRLPLAKERRKHLHRIIDMQNLDVDHETERKGRPFTLVLTKNRATYKAKCLAFGVKQLRLKEVEELLESM